MVDRSEDEIISKASDKFSIGDKLDAIKIIRDGLQEAPHNLNLLNALGDLYLASNDNQGALDAYRKSLELDSSQVDVLFNKAIIHTEQKNLSEALIAYDAILEINPRDIDARNNRGNIYQKQSRYDKALLDYKEALLAGGNGFQLYYNQGICNENLKLYVEAVSSYKEALKSNQKIPEVYLNLCNTLNLLGRYEEASEFIDRGLVLKPDHEELLNSKGVSLLNQYRYEEANNYFDLAIATNANLAEAYNNKALLLIYSDPSSAITYFNKAIDLKPFYADAQFNLATCYLSIGDYERGWQAYECRHLTLNQKKFSRPLLHGTDNIDGKIIYVHPEQGLGDYLQFCRYIPMLVEMGAVVWLEVPEALRSIMPTLSVKFKEVKQPVDGYDYHCPIMSLPYVFKTDTSSIPSPKKYLSAQPKKIEHFEKKLLNKVHYRVGIVWEGGYRPDQPKVWNLQKSRSIELKIFLEITSLKIDVISLQKGESALEQLKLIKSEDSKLDILDLSNELHDFSDTAALIENLDLVITVDTSVAHLSGALGKETWILNRYNTCWRWFSDHRTSSPWYPSVRIFTQKEPGQWEGVMSEVVIELKNYIKNNIKKSH